MSLPKRQIIRQDEPSVMSIVATPSDTVDCPAFEGAAPRGMHIEVSGDVAYIPLNSPDDTVVVKTGLPAPSYWPYRARRIMATNTTATVHLEY